MNGGSVYKRCDFAEQKYVIDRLDNPSGNRGSDVLAIAYINKTDPEHWNRNVKLTHDALNELIQQLRKLQQLANQPALDHGDNKDRIIDGDHRPLPWEAEAEGRLSQNPKRIRIEKPIITSVTQLENRYTGDCIVGSNPTLSASF